MQHMPVRAILFDVYGTLLDVHSAIARAGKELGAHAEAVSRLWRQKQLEYTWVWSLRGDYRSFQTLTSSALDYALAAHGVTSNPLKERLLSAYRQLDAFPDVAAALGDLRRRGLRLAALSNGDPDMLEEGLQSAGLRDALDALLSVAPLRIYKPDRQVYELGRSWVGAPAQEIAFVSANAREKKATERVRAGQTIVAAAVERLRASGMTDDEIRRVFEAALTGLRRTGGHRG